MNLISLVPLIFNVLPIHSQDIPDIDWSLLSGYITPQGEGVSEACLNASQVYLDALNDVSQNIKRTF